MANRWAKFLAGWAIVLSMGLPIAGRTQDTPATPTAEPSVEPSMQPTVQPTVQPADNLLMPLPPGVGTCKNNCPAKGIQFKPGQRLKVRIVNRTKHYISIEKVAGTKPILLSGLKALEFVKGGEQDPNPSIVLWEKNETPLRLHLSQPKPDLLLVEIRFAAKKPGDQSIYLRNDGRIDVF